MLGSLLSWLPHAVPALITALVERASWPCKAKQPHAHSFKIAFLPSWLPRSLLPLQLPNNFVPVGVFGTTPAQPDLSPDVLARVIKDDGFLHELRCSDRAGMKHEKETIKQCCKEVCARARLCCRLERCRVPWSSSVCRLSASGGRAVEDQAAACRRSNKALDAIRDTPVLLSTTCLDTCSHPLYAVGAEGHPDALGPHRCQHGLTC